MQNRLHPIIQAVALAIVPMIVILFINYLFNALGRGSSNSIMTATLKLSLFVVPNALFIIMHKYKLTFYGFIIAAITAIITVQGVGIGELESFSQFSLYLINFIYFSLFMGITYFAYFVINGFKLKNIVFIMGSIIIHTISYLGLFLINKLPITLELTRAIIYTATNTYLMVGLAIAIGLLFFEVGQTGHEILPPEDDEL